MKVLQVIDSGGMYGAEKVLVSLMDALAEFDVESGLASIAEPGLPEKAIEKEAKAIGIEVRRVPMSRGLDRKAARKLANEARLEGYAIFHTHGYKANTLIAGMHMEQRRLPAVATLHGWTAMSRLSRISVYEIFERWSIRRAEQVVAVSAEMAAKWRLDSRYSGRLSIIPNGVSMLPHVRCESALPKEIADFIGGREAIFAVGRLSKEKGFDDLLKVVAEIRAAGVDACLVLCGEGSQRNSLSALARELGISGAVQMPGYVPNARGLMGDFDVLAITSHTEGLPVVLLEALMAGLPVAATAVGDIPTVMAKCHAGSCAEPGNLDSIRRCLMAAISTNRREREMFSARARRYYSIDAMSARYLEIYRKVTSVQ